jgi:hypothetical protein
LDGIDRFALFNPADVGEKNASTVQMPEGTKVWPEQLSPGLANSEAFVPVRLIVPIIRFAMPEFKIVNVCAADELPTCTFPKLKLAGDTEMVGTIPVPLNGTFNVGALDGIDRFALFNPADVGENITRTVQLPKEAMVWPEQLSPGLANSEAFVPVKVTVPITRSAVPVFVIINVCEACVLPTITFPKS